jgi:hypothetical protein
MVNPQHDPAAAQRTATLIGLSLALGVTTFAGVAWYTHQNATAPRSSDVEFTRLLIYAWLALTAVTLFSALFFWRTRVQPLIHGNESLPRERLPQLSANLLICWALIESASLFGVTVYFITGVTWVAAVAVVLIWVAFLATRPQIDWYQRFR